MPVTTTTPFDLPPHTSTDEYLVVVLNARRFDLLLHKDDFLDEGVAAVFGLSGAEAELLSLSFHPDKFTPAQVAVWLAQCRFTPPVHVSISRRSSCP